MHLLFCIVLFTIIKRGMSLVFSADFLYTFSIKLFLTKYPIN